MKFGKALETGTEHMPEEWRPYVIHYKALKKKINAIVKELDDRGLPSPIIKNLLSQSMSGKVHRVQYSFDETEGTEHLKTCIKVVIDDLELTAEEAEPFGPAPADKEEQLSKLLAHELAFLNNSASSSSSDLQEQLAMVEGAGATATVTAAAPEAVKQSVAIQAQTQALAESQNAARIDSLDDLLDDDTTTEGSEVASFCGDDEGDTADHATMASTSAALSTLTSAMSSPLFNSVADSEQPAKTVTATIGTGENKSTVVHRNNLPPNCDHASKETTQGTTAPLHGPSPDISPLAPSTRPLVPSPLSQSLTQSPSLPKSPDLCHESRSPPVLASTDSTQEIMETIVSPSVQKERQTHGTSRIITTEEDGKRVLVIELTADTAFFDQLGEEISQLSKLQESNKHEFNSKVEDLSKMLTVVSSPNNKDMYTWREILKTYLDAQIFVGDQEADRSTRSSEKAKTQLQWFLKELERTKLVHKFKQSKSKIAFNTFFQLNSELITMKQFRELNQMAMTKILKKHDKRTNLTASSGFPKHLQNEPFYNDNISKSLTYTIGNQLLSIIPQPDDYACPICMSVAWKPIRLRCGHVFCVRCLIKAQRKKMLHCPVCREFNSVQDADSSNLDVSMMNFLQLYFPKEIKEKRKESCREQAEEEMEAITGQRWGDDQTCIIM